jgi:hypothetical protein
MAGQLWAVNSLGGFFYSLNLSDELRQALQPEARFRQFCDAADAVGKQKGNTYTWDIVQDVATAGGTLVETNTMPETNFTIIQGTLTVTEYGNSVPYSGKLEALSKFEVRKPVMQALRNDAKKVFDARLCAVLPGAAACRSDRRHRRDAAHPHHQRHRDAHQQRRVRHRARQDAGRHDEGAEHPALRRRRLHVDRVADHLPRHQELARVAPSVHRERHQADLQRRDRALRERALHRADERVERASRRPARPARRGRTRSRTGSSSSARTP